MKESTPQRRPKGPSSSLQRHGVVACAQVLSGAQGSRHCGPSRPRVAANLAHFRCLMIDPPSRRLRRRGCRRKPSPCPKPLPRLSPAYAPPSKCLPYPTASPFHAVYQISHTLSHLNKFCVWGALLRRSPFHSLSLLTLSLTHSLTILSPYSSYCACGHSPWVFALPGLVLLLPVISFCCCLTSPVLQRYSPLFSASASC